MVRLTLWGMSNIIPDLFDVPLPVGMDKDSLVMEIMERCGDLYPYFQNAPHLRNSVHNWFSRNLEQFSRQWRALTEDYNPIENYDRIEDGNTLLELGAGNDTTLTGEVSAYNSNAFDNDSKSTTHSVDSGQNETTTHSHIHGNIGVTTAAQMIQGELNIRDFDLYAHIAERFEDKFIVEVY